MKPYSPEQRRNIAALLEQGGPVPCPACGTELSVQPVEPVPGVAYVRHRVWVLCPGCRRTASIDIRRD